MNIRTILDRARIPWRDKGPNCSKGNVNIACPFCGTDPSFHLAISETGEDGYYCFRNPAKHSGKNLVFLFQKLGIKIDKTLLKEVKKAGIYVTVPVTKDASKYNIWRWFSPASECQEAVDYLYGRGFLFPVELCEKFNLRVTQTGRWAGRLLIPLTVGWTGRSMRSFIEPRYLSETDEDGLFISHGRGKSAIIVEGPIDGLRIASVTDQLTVIGELGGRVSPELIHFLRSNSFMDIYHCPDSTVPFDQTEYNRRLLMSYCTNSVVHATKLPDGKKDSGELGEAEVRRWLTSLGEFYSQSGPALGRNGQDDTVFKIFGDYKPS